MKNLGFYGFILSVIVLSGLGAKLPTEGDKWSDMLMPFLLTAVVATVFLVIWRRSLKSSITENTADQTASGALIGEAYRTITKWDVATMELHEVCESIDGVLQQFIQPFVSIKEREFARLGFANAAEIYIELAYAERMLNRMWSAAADNHRGEVEAVFPEASEALQRTVEKIGKQE